MGRYLLRRAVLAALVAWLVVTLTFVLLEAAPGDASLHFVDPAWGVDQRELMRARWGLDRPGWQRYLLWLQNLAMGDPGTSLVSGEPALEMMGRALPPTLLLAGLSLLASFGLGIPLGTWQAARAGTLREQGVGMLGLALYAMPRFWLGVLLIIGFAGVWPLLPGEGMEAWNHADMAPWPAFLDRVRHLVLPCCTLAIPGAVAVARHLRSSLLELRGADFLRTAASLGLPVRNVRWRHALPNGLLPVITLAGVSLPFLLAGSVLVETVFSWPGMGRLMVRSVLDRDTPVILACFLAYALLVALGNGLADLASAAVDPRVREGLSK